VKIFSRFQTATLAVIFIMASAGTAYAGLKVGEKPAPVTLSGEDGGRVDGQPWSSDMIAGKVWSVFYVDPDEKEINEKMEAALKAESFPRDKYASMAVINMDATWLPNSAIAAKLADKQKEFPDTVYAKDMKKMLVKKWGLKDDDYDCLVFDKNGSLLYSKEGALSDGDIKEMIGIIRTALQ
jgi:YtfJ family uncharacterized protein